MWLSVYFPLLWYLINIYVTFCVFSLFFKQLRVSYSRALIGHSYENIFYTWEFCFFIYLWEYLDIGLIYLMIMRSKCDYKHVEDLCPTKWGYISKSYQSHYMWMSIGLIVASRLYDTALMWTSFGFYFSSFLQLGNTKWNYIICMRLSKEKYY